MKSNEVRIAHGLEGVIALETRLSHIEGSEGRLTLRGYAASELGQLPFEVVSYLLLHGTLPTASKRLEWENTLAAARVLSPTLLKTLMLMIHSGTSGMNILRFGLSALACQQSVNKQTILGALPSILAAGERLKQSLVPVQAPVEMRQAAAFLYELKSEAASARQVEALNTYWNTVSEHGLNASTFVARTIASTQSDWAASVEGAIGALQGPLHGGAPGPVLNALLMLMKKQGDLAEHTRRWVKQELASGRRIMGFGHRVYSVRDPRADILAAAAHRLLEGSPLYAAAQVHEQAILETLAALKPGRRVATNVEFYTALLLHGIGFTPNQFTPVFALGRCAGWLAHIQEQRETGRLIRPRAHYIGEHGLTLTPESVRSGAPPHQAR